MLVKDWMNSTVITVDVNDSMQDAVKKLKDHDVRLLPVLDKGTLVGVVTDRDIKRASASDATTLEIHELLYLVSNIKIKDVMTPKPVTVPLDYTVEETAQILLKNRISGVPVVDAAGNVVGAITQADLFKVIISLTGVAQKGIQLALQVEDRPGSITKTIDIIRKHDGRIMSVLSSQENSPEGFRRIYIRTYDIDRDNLEALKAELKENMQLIYVVDHRNNSRMIF